MLLASTDVMLYRLDKSIFGMFRGRHLVGVGNFGNLFCRLRPGTRVTTEWSLNGVNGLGRAVRLIVVQKPV